MKKIILVFLLVASGLFITSHLYFSPCTQPIFYKLGRVDSKFNKKEEQLLQALKEAEAVWEKPSGRNLFEFSSQAKLTVNFVYDTRQSLKTQINQLEGNLKTQENNLDNQISHYKTLVESFTQKLNNFNTLVEMWNRQGGAPPSEYDKLLAQHRQLQKEADDLNIMAKNLNQKTQNLNLGVTKLNKTVDNFNQEIAVKPEEGIYSTEKQTIEIFFIVEQDELIHTLAHEFGHARGLAHLDNAHAIMYSQSSDILTASKDDMRVLENECRKRSYWEILKTALSYVKQH